ncbi:MAG TPA: helix-turn-helix transcriptional regulator [Jatrophihabitantaceae bacterium]|jgi:transcriptional regulator with XRE-family HTH domain
MATATARRVGRQVRAARGRAGHTTIASFAKAAGVSVTTISNLELGVRANFKDTTLDAIDAELRWPKGELRRMLGGKRPSGFPEDLQQLVDLWPRIDLKTRATLLLIARGAADQ